MTDHGILDAFAVQAIQRLIRTADVGFGKERRCQFYPHCQVKRGQLLHHSGCVTSTLRQLLRHSEWLVSRGRRMSDETTR